PFRRRATRPALAVTVADDRGFGSPARPATPAPHPATRAPASHDESKAEQRLKRPTASATDIPSGANHPRWNGARGQRSARVRLRPAMDDREGQLAWEGAERGRTAA